MDCSRHTNRAVGASCAWTHSLCQAGLVHWIPNCKYRNLLSLVLVNYYRVSIQYSPGTFRIRAWWIDFIEDSICHHIKTSDVKFVVEVSRDFHFSTQCYWLRKILKIPGNLVRFIQAINRIKEAENSRRRELIAVQMYSYYKDSSRRTFRIQLALLRIRKALHGNQNTDQTPCIRLMQLMLPR